MNTVVQKFEQIRKNRERHCLGEYITRLFTGIYAFHKITDSWHENCISSDMMQLVIRQQLYSISREVRTELIRKSIHLSIALVPFVVEIVGTAMTIALLAVGTVVYSYAEYRRRLGFTIPIITRITELSSRKRDLNTFVLGPVTLGLGAMLALLLYPNPAATIAIYALAFGDGFAALIGRIFGRVPISGTGGKTFEGSMACLVAVMVAVWLVVPDPRLVLSVAIAATLLEMMPSNDADNLILPMGTGLVATFLL